MFKPKNLEDYYYINSYGRVIHTIFYEHCFDRSQINSRNCFKTAKEAKESKFYKIFKED